MGHVATVIPDSDWIAEWKTHFQFSDATKVNKKYYVQLSIKSDEESTMNRRV